MSFDKIKRFICHFLACVFFVTVLSSPMLCNAYSVVYDQHHIGYVGEQNQIKDIKNKINKEIIGKDCSIKPIVSEQVVISMTHGIDSSRKIAEKILNAEQDVALAYCLVIDEEVYYTALSETEIEDYINCIKDDMSLRYNGQEIYMLGEYSIKYGYCRQNVLYSQYEIESKLKLYPAECRIRTEEESIPFGTVYKFGYKDGKVAVKGVPGKKCVEFADLYANNVFQKTGKVREYISSEPIAQVVLTTDYDKVSENTTLLDAAILGLSDSQTEFLNELLPIAKQGYDEYNLPISLALAQAVLESGWGEHAIGHNLFGMKAYSNWTGKTVISTTQEYNEETEEYETFDLDFRDYDSFADSVKDYQQRLLDDRYKKVRIARDYREAAQAVKEAGYATSPTYTEKLIGVIEKYKLYSWDKIDVELKPENDID